MKYVISQQGFYVCVSKTKVNAWFKDLVEAKMLLCLSVVPLNHAEGMVVKFQVRPPFYPQAESHVLVMWEVWWPCNHCRHGREGKGVIPDHPCIVDINIF